MNHGGYAGKILRINLSTRKISTEDYPENIRKKYLGGRGTAAYLYYDLRGWDEDAVPKKETLFALGIIP